MACLKWSNGIGCIRCREKKQACPRTVDFRVAYIARQVGWSEVYARNLYSLHVVNRHSSTKASGSSTAGANESKNSRKAANSSRETIVIIEDDDELEESEEDRNFKMDSDTEVNMDNREKIHVSPRKPNKVSGQNPTSGKNGQEAEARHIVSTSSKGELVSLRKEVECKD